MPLAARETMYGQESALSAAWYGERHWTVNGRKKVLIKEWEIASLTLMHLCKWPYQSYGYSKCNRGNNRGSTGGTHLT